MSNRIQSHTIVKNIIPVWECQDAERHESYQMMMYQTHQYGHNKGP